MEQLHQACFPLLAGEFRNADRSAQFGCGNDPLNNLDNTQQGQHDEVPGLNKGVFRIYKFRSMRDTGTRNTSFLQTERDDPRTTRIGKFIRQASLDELPQLLNVLQGNMSLIGPRPHPLPLDDEYEKLIDGYSSRYRVKPGITGWAQVNGHRGAVDGVASMRSRVEHDRYYIENWSLMLDLKILLMTLRNGFFHKNAY